MEYRKDIDGLRAIAVLSVLAFHFGAPVPGGFTGVDVFFVISGFLITGNLTSDIRRGEFSILKFYDRRIRRIVPALLVVLVASLIAGIVLQPPGDLMSLASSAAAAAFGLSNFYFLNNTGYFDQAADLMPLLHTWSLAVEEQFYLVWPPLLYVIARRPSWTTTTIAVLTIAGFFLSLAWLTAAPKGAFFSVLPRAWELAIGALLIFLPPLPRIADEIATVVGLAILGAGFAVVSAAHFPGFSALYPCIGAALVVWPRTRSTIAGRALGVLSPVGLISYSLYLWHWPVWVFFRIYINNAVPNTAESSALATISILLATLSYIFVERPTRRMRWRGWHAVTIGFTSCAAIFVVSMYVRADGLPNRLSRDASATASLPAMWDYPCNNGITIGDLKPMCVYGAPWTTERKAILWGDSNAEQLVPIIDMEGKRANVSVAVNIPCPAPLDDSIEYVWPEFGPTYSPNCRATRKAILAFLDDNHGVDTVIIAASWLGFMSNIVPTGEADPDRAKLLYNALSRILIELRTIGKHVIVVRLIPHWSFDPLPCGVTAGFPRRPCSQSLTTLTLETVRSRNATVDGVLQSLQNKMPDVRFIDPVDSLCATGKCITHLNGEFLYRDAYHFRRNLSAEATESLSLKTGLSDSFNMPPIPTVKP